VSFCDVKGITEEAAKELDTENEELTVKSTGYTTMIQLIIRIKFKRILIGVDLFMIFLMIILLLP
jgi:hypothetical protein